MRTGPDFVWLDYLCLRLAMIISLNPNHRPGRSLSVMRRKPAIAEGGMIGARSGCRNVRAPK